ncbi:MAG: LamG domain-containing protein [Bacteroidota bacterium]
MKGPLPGIRQFPTPRPQQKISLFTSTVLGCIGLAMLYFVTIPDQATFSTENNPASVQGLSLVSGNRKGQFFQDGNEWIFMEGKSSASSEKTGVSGMPEVAGRWEKSWHLSKVDENANGGLINLIFDLNELGAEYDPNRNYYLLFREDEHHTIEKVNVSSSFAPSFQNQIQFSADGRVVRTGEYFLAYSHPGPGYALQLNGQQRLMVNQPIREPLHEMTLSAWVKVDGQHGEIVSRGKDGQPGAFRLRSDGHFIGWNESGKKAIQLSWAPLPQNKWVHIGLAYTYDKAKVWVNGVELSDLNAKGKGGTFGSLSPQKICIGDGMVGAIDEVRIWRHAVSQEELIDFMNRSLDGNEAGLLAYYRMDQSSGRFLADHSGNRRIAYIDGVDIGSTNWTPSKAPLNAATTASNE